MANLSFDNLLIDINNCLKNNKILEIQNLFQDIFLIFLKSLSKNKISFNVTTQSK